MVTKETSALLTPQSTRSTAVRKSPFFPSSDPRPSPFFISPLAAVRRRGVPAQPEPVRLPVADPGGAGGHLGARRPGHEGHARAALQRLKEEEEEGGILTDRRML